MSFWKPTKTKKRASRPPDTGKAIPQTGPRSIVMSWTPSTNLLNSLPSMAARRREITCWRHLKRLSMLMWNGAPMAIRSICGTSAMNA